MLIEKRNVTRFELLIDAGLGAQKAGDILLAALVAGGRHVFVEPLIPSEISPAARSPHALSGTIIRLADHDLTNIGNDTDLILAAHEIVLDRRLNDREFNPNCRILLDIADRNRPGNRYEEVLGRCLKEGLTVIPFEIDEASRAIIQEMRGKGQNLFYLGMLGCLYCVELQTLESEIRKTFRTKLSSRALEQNIEICRRGYRLAGESALTGYQVAPSPLAGDRVLIDGNTALALGIIDAGFKLFSGYPISPASTIMHTLAREFPSYGGSVHQAEDEIAAIGTAIGAWFGGTPAITATSGPGLSLKQEFIGFAQAAEIPIVIIDVQRSGPSTGMPTRTEQSDLLAAIYGAHGDQTKVVLGVADLTDCFYAPHLARYLAETLRLPVIVMSDFHTAHAYKAIPSPRLAQLESAGELPDFVFERFRLKRLSGPVTLVHPSDKIPGGPGDPRRVTGLNTESSGRVSSSGVDSQRNHVIRNEKIHQLRRSLSEPEMFGGPAGKILIVGWGSTRGAIEEAVTQARGQNISLSGMHLKMVHPLPIMLKELFAAYDQIMTVEVAYGDELKPSPLAMLLRAETLRDVQPLVAFANGQPLRPAVILAKAIEAIGEMQATTAVSPARAEAQPVIAKISNAMPSEKSVVRDLEELLP